MTHTCETDLEPCEKAATFQFYWPGELFARHACDGHIIALSRASDLGKLGAMSLDGVARVEPRAVPGADEIQWVVVRP